VHIMVTKDLRQTLNWEGSAEINRMLAIMQGYDFLKLAITAFESIDKYAAILQVNSLSVNKAVQSELNLKSVQYCQIIPSHYCFLMQIYRLVLVLGLGLGCASGYEPICKPEE